VHQPEVDIEAQWRKSLIVRERLLCNPILYFDRLLGQFLQVHFFSEHDKNDFSK